MGGFVSNVFKSAGSLIGGVIPGLLGQQAEAPAPAAADPVTSANQSRISAATDAQAKANAQIAADKKRRKAGTVFTDAETSATTTTGKNTLG